MIIMNRKKCKKLLIIQLDQFGYLTDTLKWCEHLNDSCQIEIVCYDSKNKRIHLPNVAVKYVQLSSNRIFHALNFFITAISTALFFSGKIIVVAFPHCDWIKRFLFWKRLHLDIRTVSVSRNETERNAYDKQLHEYGLLYDSVTVISEGVKNRLLLSEALILPLGADVISTKGKDYSCMSILYIGTLKGREIHKTIEGCYNFLKTHPDIKFSYDIIGDALEENGKKKLSDKYRELVKSLGIESYVNIHGAKPYNELQPYIDNANYGVSFVPITPWYDVQPPTKTFEYAMSGLYVIATGTICNKEVIFDNNGIIIDDTPEDFMRALETIYSNWKNYDEFQIRTSLTMYNWKYIVNSILKPLLEK